jgi:signal transduction histidine kinase
MDQGIENFLNLDKMYILDDKLKYLAIPYAIPDINGNLMGYALSFKPLDEINIDQAIYLKNNVANLMFILVLLTVLAGYYIINRKHQKYIMLQHIKHQQDLVKSTKFQTIGEMAAGITHEINTPLTYIKGTLEMSKLELEKLPKSKTKDQLNEDFETIYNGVNRIGIIVESMKEMAQSSISQKERFNVYQTLIIVLRMIHNKSKHISPIYINGELFSLESSDTNKEQYFANIHVQRIEQVWTIILNNALDELLKIEDYDQRRIDITLEALHNKLIVKFTDNAGGIPRKMLAKIFEPFVSTKQSSGIGIGLNVAKKIIEEHNASISVENTKDGACFRVILDYLPN